MARNLRAKIPAEDTLLVWDVNPEASQRVVTEEQQNGATNIKVADGARQIAEEAVQSPLFPLPTFPPAGMNGKGTSG